MKIEIYKFYEKLGMARYIIIYVLGLIMLSIVCKQIDCEDFLMPVPDIQKLQEYDEMCDLPYQVLVNFYSTMYVVFFMYTTVHRKGGHAMLCALCACLGYGALLVAMVCFGKHVATQFEIIVGSSVLGSFFGIVFVMVSHTMMRTFGDVETREQDVPA